MKTYNCDVVIVGAGPGGSMAAKYCAQAGLDTILIEKKAEIGAPLRCAEGVSKSWLHEVGIEPDPAWISDEMIGAIVKSPNGTTFRMDGSSSGSEIGYVLERHLFDKALARQAAEAGATIMMRTGCTDVIRKDGKLVGIKAQSMGEPIEIHAKCVIAADGYESQVARWAGMETAPDLGDINSCIQYRMANIDIEQGWCEFLIGNEIAPGGYLWMFPKGNRTANVGIGIRGNRCKEPAAAKTYLDKWIAQDDRLKNGQILEVASGMVSTCPGLDSAIDDNLILVGDAARIIDPITGGGICHACRTGMYAGKVLAECAKKNDFSKQALKPYEKMWRDRMEDKIIRNWMAKEKMNQLEDEVMDDIVKMIASAPLKQLDVYGILKSIKEKYPEVVEEFSDLI
ncbi:MAG TPA: NAD(P)/FAD-dependent oxidoreductase [Candidatus Methanomethylophilaceae archaeon]|nr:NAD(P)/FAD-dependent oxidoreductase [Candidatus Methanomethylophilaceae archaeon]